MLFGILVFLFVLVCILLVFLILIQSDKGGGLSSAFGGGSLNSASNLLGTQDTANILTRGTAIFGGAFLLLCIVMSFVLHEQNGNTKASILQEKINKEKELSPSTVLEKDMGAGGMNLDNPEKVENPGLPGDSK